MGGRELINAQHAPADVHPPEQPAQPDALAPLLMARAATLNTNALPEVVIGELVALADDAMTPLVTYPGQPGSAALRARSVLDLHGAHIGQSVVLSFEGGDGNLPVVMGVLRNTRPQTPDAPGRIHLEADGERMIISAKEQLVLQCGQASITLTRAGKVLIQGSYVSSRSTGVNRVKGGSVQLN